MNQTPRTACAILATLLSFPAMAHTESASADHGPCSGGANPTETTQSTDLTVDAGRIVHYDCAHVIVRGNITVGNGGELRLSAARLLFHPRSSSPLNLTVASGGILNVTSESEIQPASPSAPPIRFYMAPGAATAPSAQGGLVLIRPEPVTIASSEITLYGFDVRHVAGNALRIQNSSPTLYSLRVENATDGVAVEGATSTPVFNGAQTHDVEGIALRVGPGARTTSEGSVWNAGGIGIFLRESSVVAHRNGTFGDSPEHARLVSSDSQGATLLLEGTAHDETRIAVGAKSTLKVAWFVRTRATWDSPAPTGSQPGDAISGATIQLWDDAEKLQATRQSDLTGRTGPLPLLSSIQTGATSTQLNPFRIIAVKGSSANQTTVMVNANRLVDADLLVVRVPHDADNDPPRWTSATPLAVEGLTATSDGVALSNDGSIHLTWAPATDQPTNEENTHPNRNVSHYEIQRISPETLKVFTTPATKLVDVGLQNGTYSYRARPIDLAGNIPSTFSNELTIRVDRERPKIVLTANRTAGGEPWHFNRTFHVNITATDDLTGIDRIEYKLGSAAFTRYASNLTGFSQPGTYTLVVRAYDKAQGKTEQTVNLVHDRRLPQILTSLSPSLPNGEDGWFKTAPTLTFSAVDSDSSKAPTIQYRLSNGEPWNAYSVPIKLDTTGDHTVSVRATDAAENVATSMLRVPVDVDPPVAKIEVDGDLGASAWYKSAVTLDTAVSDPGSGPGRLTHRFGTGPWFESTDRLILLESGTHRIGTIARDRAGNAALEKTTIIQIDRDPPVPPSGFIQPVSNGQLSINWSGAAPFDLISGVAEVQIRARSQQAELTIPLDVDEEQQRAGALPRGRYTVRLEAIDRAGHVSPGPWQTVDVEDGALATAAEFERYDARGAIRLSAFPVGIPPANISEARFYVDDELVHATAEPPFEFQWDTRGFADGPHAVRVVVIDLAGGRHERTATVETRNSWQAAIADHPLQAGSAIGLAALTTVLSLAGIIQWRRWRAI